MPDTVESTPVDSIPSTPPPPRPLMPAIGIAPEFRAKATWFAFGFFLGIAGGVGLTWWIRKRL